MRESRTYGFVRGAHSNMRPYRDPYLATTDVCPGLGPSFGDRCVEPGP
jgi:hypothetical protein